MIFSNIAGKNVTTKDLLVNLMGRKCNVYVYLGLIFFFSVEAHFKKLAST